MLLRSGGSGTRTPGQLDAELERLGASIDSNIGETTGTVSFSTLAENTAAVLALFRDLLTSPAFRLDRVDVAKSTLLNGVSRRNDDPEELLGREFRALAYGAGSAQGRRPEYSSIAAAGRAEIVAFYRRYFFPANTMLADFGGFQERRHEGGDRSPVCGLETPTAARPGISKSRHARESALTWP